MPRISLLALSLALACSKTAPQEQAVASSVASASGMVVGAASHDAPAVPPAANAWYVGNWKGDFNATKRAASTTTKEGGPAAWEKDDGKQLAGAGSLTVTIGAGGDLTGALSGALGDIPLHGRLDGEELRATIVANGDDPKAIHNGYLALVHDGEVLKGQLNAATGDALALRQAEVTLKKAAP